MSVPVIVVGAGWSGLACALALARAGERVVVLEAAGRPGGRARSLARHGGEYDNGQHLLLCACAGVIGEIAALGVDLEQAFLRLPLAFHFQDRDGACLQIAAASRPWPLHLVQGVLQATGLRLPERLALAATLPELLFQDPAPEGTVREWLATQAQPPALCRRFWDALCVSALNTDPEHASARLFVRVLRETFRPPARRADMWIPRLPLAELFPLPAVRHLQALGAAVRLRHRAVRLEARPHGVRVHCRNGARFEGRVVLAVPPWTAARLLADFPGMAALAARLARLRPAPVTTLWLEYDRPPPLPAPVIGLLDTPFQFVFDHAPLGRPGRLALVASGPQANRALSTMEAPVRTAHALLRARCPGWPHAEPTGWWLRERRATFLATPAAERLRPGNATGHPHLMLAGDWTATGLPATLEGAVRSGLAAARTLLD